MRFIALFLLDVMLHSSLINTNVYGIVCFEHFIIALNNTEIDSIGRLHLGLSS